MLPRHGLPARENLYGLSILHKAIILNSEASLCVRLAHKGAQKNQTDEQDRSPVF